MQAATGIIRKPNGMKNLHLIAVALLAGVSASPAAAQEPIQLILNFDGSTLGDTLTQIGATWEKRSAQDGSPFYTIKFRNGANAVAVPAVCSGEQPHTNCTGLRLWANFSKPEQLATEAVAQRVNQFNVGHTATMVSYADNGSAQINMYLISDFGIAIQNMRVKLQVFESSTAAFSQSFYAQ